ncbi:unnamed protein product [Blepharisma stoltei]|uniref:Uncharacterized protein n=1 Tax=Blepharisma stoltei TaxID=1481888 RepID=A0AAU9JA95_9CILI|nr:unnamed protein product [Blepharisma stoltei]
MSQICYLCDKQAILKCGCTEACTLICNVHWKDHISSNFFISHALNPIEKTLKPVIVKQLELYYEKSYEAILAAINHFNANVETLIEQINDSRASILKLSEETLSKNYRHLQNLKNCPLEYLSYEEAIYFLTLDECSSIENYLIEHHYFSYNALEDAILLFNKRRNFIGIKEELKKTKEELNRLRAKNLIDSMDVEAYKQMVAKWDSQIKEHEIDLIRKEIHLKWMKKSIKKSSWKWKSNMKNCYLMQIKFI